MNKAIFWILLTTTLFISILAWYRFVHTNNYQAYIHLPCDTYREKCFDYGDETYYKIALIPAKIIKGCSPDDGLCALARCEESNECAIIECSDESLRMFEIEGDCNQIIESIEHVSDRPL